MGKILITGGNGVLGSALSKMFLDLGDEVNVIDTVRQDECWRLISSGIQNQVNYTWKSSLDISPEEVNGFDMIVDCAIGFPDRPFGNSSPVAAIKGNIDPAIGLLESLRKLQNPPPVVYPSSFNALYGYQGIYSEQTPANPSSIYGWTKAAIESLYTTYHHSFNIPVVVTRVGSSFGEMMRTDELVARMILSNIHGGQFQLRSPYSKRLWTYLRDVIGAYKKLVKKSDYLHRVDFFDVLQSRNYIINVAGNVGDEILNNVDLTRKISHIMHVEHNIVNIDYYEPGEMVNGNPINFDIDAAWSRTLLGWKPEYTLKQGLERTIDWFYENQDRWGIWNTQ